MLVGIDKAQGEDFSFALAVALTPPVVLRESLRLMKAQTVSHTSLTWMLASSIFGGGCALLAGLVALKWLSSWLERGRWYVFGVYCLFAAVVVGALYFAGY